ncbi:hypothetical protein [Nonlabens ulvanivorans]|uniref:Uncharacterized protein n=1 Tax=Nonlabens ulvanivorans TaxID=906888 RepID=A0A081D6X5_NONUL|nr:hypothetical protein [Nonlabens ulvanivorans]GAK74671.1 hypothetical protein JCM19296_249 [Nonlabens ulvanivorans]GAK98542.1 hypothetical protein JCM19314_2573 [Nonlabens ulvanivorans]GAL73841.1 hypothetical protein JCM19275_2688 [Nonlabens ulvanivorans]
MFTLIAVTSCEKDDVITQEEKDFMFPKLSGSVITVDQLLKNPDLKDKVLALSKGSINKSGVTGIQIDTSRIEVMESSDFTTYTFQIVQDSIEKQSILKNYMLTIVNDTLQVQHLVSYPV